MGEIKLPRHMFLWSMALVYLIAFTSIYVQIPGLYGNEGLLPVRHVQTGVPKDRPLLEQLHASPSLLWLGLGPELGLELDAQQVMELLSLLGILLALGATILQPLRDSLVFLLLWALYLSLYQVGQDFLHFVGDKLLLEAGFLAILIAPLYRWRSAFRHHDTVTFWLARWLLFRLTFGSGVGSLASRSATWWDLTAVSHNLEAQGSPTPLAWFAHQVPSWLLRLATVGVLVSQIAIPVLYFVPIRCLRLGAFYIQLFVQGCSMLTGNITVLNLLSVVLSFSLLDDQMVNSWLGHSKKKRAKTRGQSLLSVLSLLVELSVYILIIYCAVMLFQMEINWEAKTISSKTAFSQQQFDELLKLVVVPSIWVGVLSLTWELVASMLGCLCLSGFFWKLWALLQWAVFGAATVGMFTLSVVPYAAMEKGSSSRMLPDVIRAHSLVERYGLVSGYAPDTTLTQEDGRPEVVLEGSMDNETWTEIELMYKPGKMNKAPPVVSPYQARLDWQLWRAAQGAAQPGPWFTSLVHRLLQGKRDVIRLLQTDQAKYPFSHASPTYVRAHLYKYWFTKKDKDGSSPKLWWRRRFVREFYPAVRLEDATLDRMLDRHGLKEKVADQPRPDTFLSKALKNVRGYVETLSGPLLLWSLLTAVVVICLLKSLTSRKRRKPESSAADKPSARPKGQKKNSEGQRDSEKNPRKRK